MERPAQAPVRPRGTAAAAATETEEIVPAAPWLRATSDRPRVTVAGEKPETERRKRERGKKRRQRQRETVKSSR